MDPDTLEISIEINSLRKQGCFEKLKGKFSDEDLLVIENLDSNQLFSNNDNPQSVGYDNRVQFKKLVALEWGKGRNTVQSIWLTQMVM